MWKASPCGVIHRDIKPANILPHDGNPVVSDFGIALALGVAGVGRLTETGLSLRTPHHMSPEQATGDPSVAAATDVHALGCASYEMLVGEPPYTGSRPQAVLGRIISGSPPSASAERRSVPPNVDAAVRKALEKVPADRFIGASAFARALSDTAFRHGGATGAAGEPTAARANRLATAGWVTAAVSALVAGWALLGTSEGAPELTTERVSLLLPLERSVQFGCTRCCSRLQPPERREFGAVKVAPTAKRAVRLRARRAALR